jgi:uncharacterized protein (DUF433 family)
MEEHPLIYFRDGAAGRRPALLGTRLDVADVIETLRQNGNSMERTAAYLELPLDRVEACLRYYAVYREEIDDWIERSRAIAEREEERRHPAKDSLRNQIEWLTTRSAPGG